MSSRPQLERKLSHLSRLLTLNKMQSIVYQMVAEGNNIFITGSGGTGKTYLAESIISSLDENSLAVCAPTGMAALLVSGSTIHSFFGFPTGYFSAKEVASDISDSKAELYRSIKTLIIEEVSLVRADMMDNIDLFLRLVRKSAKPFGGLQIIMLGDFTQNEPIVNEPDEIMNELKERYSGNYYCFNSFAWSNSNIIEVSLLEPERNKDSDYLQCLRNIRFGNNLTYYIDRINQIVCSNKADDDWMIISSSVARVDEINRKMISNLNTPSLTYYAEKSKSMNNKNLPADVNLTVYEGERVMILANGGSYFNGDTGTVETLGSNWVSVKLDRGKTVKVKQHTWKTKRYHADRDNITGERKIKAKDGSTFTQIPLRAAYASTIHKIQGQTLGKVILDLDRELFADGMAYVALSRVVSSKNIVLTRPLLVSDIKFNSDAIDFMKRIGFDTLNNLESLEGKYPLEQFRSDISEKIEAIKSELETIPKLPEMAIPSLKSKPYIKEKLRKAEIALVVGIKHFISVLLRNGITTKITFRDNAITQIEFHHSSNIYTYNQITGEKVSDFLNRNMIKEDQYSEIMQNELNLPYTQSSNEKSSRIKQHDSLLKLALMK